MQGVIAGVLMRADRRALDRESTPRVLQQNRLAEAEDDSRIDAVVERLR